MTAYARSDVGQVHVILADHEHDHIRANADRFQVECEVCEEFLLSTFPDQWSSRADRIPLTPDEMARKHELAEEGNVAATSLARALGEHAEALAAGGGF